MAVIMACAWGGTGHYLVKDNITGADVRGSHTIMVRAKWSTTTTTANYYPAVLCTSAATSGGFVGRLASDPDGTNRTRGARFSTTPTYDRVSKTGSFGDTTTWRHLCMVYNATTQIVEYYVDGVSVGTVSSTTTLVAADTAGAFGCLATGKFADLALYNRALTAGEVAQMAAGRALTVTSNCLGFYRMDTNSSGGTTEGNATDTSGSGNTLTANTSAGGTGFTYSTADNPPQPDYALSSSLTTGSTLTGTLTVSVALTGAPTTASTLAGDLRLTKQLAAAPTSASTLTGDLRLTKQLAAAPTTASTLAAWIRPRWGRRIVDRGSTNLFRGGLSIPVSTFTWMAWLRGMSMPTNGDLLNAEINGTGFVARVAIINALGTQSWSLRVYDGTSTTVIYGAAVDSAWHHAALTYDGTNVRAYIDGSLVATTAITFAGSTATLLSVNTDNVNDGSYGEIAHIKCWSSQLSVAEIVQEKDFYTPAHQTGSLAGWWQLGWQNVTLDSSGHGLTLTNSDSDEAQTESPGLPLTDLAGAPTTASTLTGDLRVSKVLTGAATSASTLTGALSQAQPLLGAATSATTLTGTLSQAQPLVGAATDASTLAGTLSQQQPLVGAATTASTLAGDLRVAVPLAGAASSASTLAGTLGQALVLAGAATTTSSLTGALGITGAFQGNSLTTSSLSGTLSVDKPIAGNATTSSALTGVLSQQQPLTATASSASTLTGALTTIKQCAGDATTASSLAGTLSIAIPIAGAASSASTLTGALSLTQQLAAAAQSASTLTGALTVQNLLSGAVTSSSTLTGALTILGVIKQLVVAATTNSTLSGSLTVTVPAAARGNVVTNGRATAYYGDVIGPQRIRREWPPRPR